MMVLLNVAPVKVAPFVVAFWRLASVKSTKLKLTKVRFAFVSIAPVRSPLLKLALVRFARPKLAPSQMMVVPKVDYLAWLRVTTMAHLQSCLP